MKFIPLVIIAVRGAAYNIAAATSGQTQVSEEQHRQDFVRFDLNQDGFVDP